MNAKMIIGICLVVFIIGGLVFLRLKNRRKYGTDAGGTRKKVPPHFI